MNTPLIILIVLFFVLMLLGLPISFSTALACAAYIMLEGKLPFVLIPQKMFAASNSTAMIAIPMFMLAGEFMNNGGLTKKIVNFSSNLVGHITGGLAHVTVLASAIFAGMSGSSAAAGSSIGSMMIPVLKEDGYPEEFAVSVTAAAAILGPVIPPSIAMVMYASITGTSTGKLFVGGIIPGVLIALALMVVSYYKAKRHGYGVKKAKMASLPVLGKSFLTSFPSLLMPVLIIVGILTGAFTATEAGVVAVFYAAIVGFVTRELKPGRLMEIFNSTAKTTANIMFIVTTAQVMGWILTSEQIPQKLARVMTSMTNNKYIILLLIVVLLLFLGCFMIEAAIICLVTPILFPVVTAFGVDPVHFGLILCITVMMGGITPPVGAILYITSGIGKVPVLKTAKAIIPFLLAELAIVVLCVFLPQLVTFLPNVVS